MPHVIVFTPHTRVFTRLRQSETWKVCLSSFSPGLSKDVDGGGAGVTGVGGADGGKAGVATVGVAGTPCNAAESTTPISDWGLHFLKMDTSWYRAMVWNFNTKTWGYRNCAMSDQWFCALHMHLHMARQWNFVAHCNRSQHGLHGLIWSLSPPAFSWECLCHCHSPVRSWIGCSLRG